MQFAGHRRQGDIGNGTVEDRHDDPDGDCGMHPGPLRQRHALGSDHSGSMLQAEAAAGPCAGFLPPKNRAHLSVLPPRASSARVFASCMASKARGRRAANLSVHPHVEDQRRAAVPLRVRRLAQAPICATLAMLPSDRGPRHIEGTRTGGSARRELKRDNNAHRHCDRLPERHPDREARGDCGRADSRASKSSRTTSSPSTARRAMRAA